MRDTFLKLLRPGLDYEKVFVRHCKRKWFKLERSAEEEEKDFEEVLKDKFDIDTVPTMAEALELFEMDKQDMRKIMSDLGVRMEESQLRRLIDAFDANGNSSVSKNEFLNFCNPDGNPTRPAQRGDTAAVLERKCVCETTCRVTGMPNAFVVTASKKNPNKGEKEKEKHVEVVEKSDGTFRRIVELEERRKRWAVLKGYGLAEEAGGSSLEKLDKRDKKRLISSGNPSYRCEQAAWDTLELFEFDEEDGTSKGKKGSKKEKKEKKKKKKKEKTKGGDDDDDDDDDYSDDASSSGSDYASSDSDSDKGEQHNLRVKRQQKALRLLLSMSATNRAANALRDMMEKGKPPPAPELFQSWTGGRVPGAAPSTADCTPTSLLLRWRALPGSLVAFFSLETSGPLGSKSQQANEFAEIYRDPQTAEGEAEFERWVEDLVPNTT